jgi:hypothetical protein
MTAGTRADTDPLREDLRGAIQALVAAVQALTQATQVIHATAQQMVQIVQSRPGEASDVTQGSINVWEDDPFSERVPTPDPGVTPPIAERIPPAPPPNLRWQISEPRPDATQHAPGTTEFRYWNAEASLARGVRFWATPLPQGTRWSIFAPTLPVKLVAGQRLNARYARTLGLEFFQQRVGQTQIFSGESPDVICHELGHAILDALRPELFDAASTEADAFHEAFGDITSILAALQIPSLRQKILAETAGRLNVNSRLSRVAEQLGWGIRQLTRDAVDRDSLRNAANRFFYRAPATLPPRAPATQLSTEPHSFARVFTGAFLDALSAMATVVAPLDDANLEMVSRDMGQLLVDGIHSSPITPEYFSQIAATMVQAARVRNGGRYRSALLRAFVDRGLLALEAVHDLGSDTAPTPQFRPVTRGMDQEVSGGPAYGVTSSASGGSSMFLAFEGSVSDGYQRDATDAPGLALRQVHAEFLDGPILAHAPAEPARFNVAPATTGAASFPVEDATDAARRYLEDLIQLDRIDPGPAKGIVAELNRPSRNSKTHKLDPTPQGLVLRRIQFQCCFYSPPGLDGMLGVTNQYQRNLP